MPTTSFHLWWPASTTLNCLTIRVWKSCGASWPWLSERANCPSSYRSILGSSVADRTVTLLLLTVVYSRRIVTDCLDCYTASVCLRFFQRQCHRLSSLTYLQTVFRLERIPLSACLYANNWNVGRTIRFSFYRCTTKLWRLQHVAKSFLELCPYMYAFFACFLWTSRVAKNFSDSLCNQNLLKNVNGFV